MKITLGILVIICVTLLGCADEPFECHCDTSFVQENDSIISIARLDSSIITLDNRFNQLPLELNESEAYRVYIRHSLRKHFQVYTLVKGDDGAELQVNEYVGSSGYSLDNELDTTFSVHLTENDWNSIKKSIDTNCFWTLRFDDGVRHETLDGGEMILEGYQPNKRNCANTDFYVLVDWVSKEPRIYEILSVIRKYAKEDELHLPL